MRILSVCLVLLAFWSGTLFAQPAQTVGSFSSAQDTARHPVEIRRIDSHWMAHATTLARLLSLGTQWNPGAKRLQIGNSFWTQDNPWVFVGDSLDHLSAPTRLQDGALWIAVPSGLSALHRASGTTLSFDSNSLSLQAGPRRDVLSVNMETLANGEILELHFPHAVRAEKFQSAPYTILRFENITLDSSLFHAALKKSTLLSRLQPIQDRKTAQLTLLPKDACESVELLRRDSGKTWQVLLRKKHGASSASVASSSSAAAKSGPAKIHTIVIDPGHGGKDPGAVGVKGLQEKDVVLNVAKKLKKKLAAQGYEVKLTREGDTFVELPERPAMASQWEGDLFISLHCNAVDGATRQKKTEGFKFYILREAESEEDKAIARRENKAIELSASKKGKSEITPVEWILLENQLNAYTKESERFAGYLVDSYEGGQIKKMSSGAGQAGFMVLVGAFMPAVLVEVGFITHPDDAAWMSSVKGQDDIANRLLKAIKAYGKAVGN